jgi:hypothetical protein
MMRACQIILTFIEIREFVTGGSDQSTGHLKIPCLAFSKICLNNDSVQKKRLFSVFQITELL